MKKLLAIVALAGGIVSCGSSQNDESASKQYMTDTTMTSQDYSMGDTTDLNGPMGDSTSASGIHGAGSGSRVGGGVTGGPQGKGADSTEK